MNSSQVPIKAEKRSSVKLTDEQAVELATRIALYESPKSIKAYFRTACGIKLENSHLMNYRNSPRWAPMIRKIRDDYNSQISDLVFSSKRKRVEELERIFDEAFEEGDRSEQRETLKQIKDELEPSGRGNTNIQNMMVVNQNFKELSDEELEEKKLETINLIAKLRRQRCLSVENLENQENEQGA